MAYSHDRTLLSSLGFSDPDKKDPLHDLGCQYISLPSVVDSLGLVSNGAKLSLVSARLEQPISKGEGKYRTTIGFLDVLLCCECAQSLSMFCSTETYVCFSTYRELDIAQKEQDGQGDVFTFCIPRPSMPGWKEHPDDPGCLYRGGTVFRKEQLEQNPYVLQKAVLKDMQIQRREDRCVEVKILPISLGDILRQINLYREYIGNVPFVLATVFDLSVASVKVLQDDNITPVFLGAKFKAWAREQRDLPRASVVEV